MNIVIDFDGTCVSHEFPMIGNDIGSIPVLKKLISNGHCLILFTMRCDSKYGKFLSEAVEWFIKNGIPLYGIQKNPTQLEWTTSPKAFGDLIIDDTALGCPLKFDEIISKKEFVDWVKVEKMLIEMGVIKK